MPPNSAAEPSALLTLADVARRLRVSRATVYAWAADGTLPVIRLGPRPLLRVHPEALEAWLQATARDSAKENRDAGNEVPRQE